MYRKFYTSTKHNYWITVYLCFVWFSEQRENIYIYSNSTFFVVTDMEIVYCSVGPTIYKNQCTLVSKEAVPWFRRLVADLWKSGLRFVSKTFHLGYVVGKLWHCNRLLSQYLNSTLSVLFCTRSVHTFINVALSEEQTVMAWKTSKRDDELNTWSLDTLEQDIKFRRLISFINLLFL